MDSILGILETKPADILRVGKKACMVHVLGIVVPFLKFLFAGEAAAMSEIAPPNAGGIVAQGNFCRLG